MTTPTAQERLLSALQTATNRLEYLTQNDWHLIADKAEQLTFKKGAKLLHQGSQTKSVYLLVKGTALIQSDSKTKIAQIGPGEICGEMAFLEQGNASASVIAEEDIDAFAVHWSALEDLFGLYPHLGSRFYRSLAVSLSRRLRQQILPKPASKS